MFPIEAEILKSLHSLSTAAKVLTRSLNKYSVFKFILPIAVLPLHVIKLSLSINFFLCCISSLLASSLTAYWKRLLSAKQTKFDDFFICVLQVGNKYDDRTSCLKDWRIIDTLLYFTRFIYLFPEREQFNFIIMRKKTRALHEIAF